jgi:DNA-binding NtrC family response regulator
VQLTACQALVETLVRRDEWRRATDAVRRALEGLDHLQSRAELAALLAWLLMVRGELSLAEATLTSAAAALASARVPPVSALERARAELCFWQGQFDEAADRLRGLPVSTDVLALGGLVAWARGDAICTRRAAAALSDGSDDCRLRGFWTCALSVLAGALDRDQTRVLELAPLLETRARRTAYPRLIRLGQAVVVEALVAVGARAEANRSIERCAPTTTAPELDVLLLTWMRGAGASPCALAQTLPARIRRVGASGITRWRSESFNMHLVHAIPAVLELVQDAEDELAAITASCAWLRRECGAEAAAVLGADGSVLAADGWIAADAADFERTAHADPSGLSDLSRAGRVLVRAPVRYAGVEMGHVAARGSVDGGGMLASAVRTVAALCAPAVRSRLDALAALGASQRQLPEILGRSPAIVSLREMIGRAAATPFAVLIEGESGTGKELVARAIHRLSVRRDRRFCAVNCAALADELVEAELFGHARGAFTGAVGPRAGLFEEAHGGSLFLDEVSELSARAQAKLLRVLQEREVRRIGENAPRPVDARVLAATNRPLAEAVGRGTFREDLLFRLAVVRLALPALRDRVEDIPVLAQFTWRALTLEAGKRVVLGPDALARLCGHGWPGNVRELQNVMASLVVLAPARGRVGARHVHQVLGQRGALLDDATLTLQSMRASCERRAVAGALARHGGRRGPAARDLGLTRQGLTKAMKRLGLDPCRETSGVA